MTSPKELSCPGCKKTIFWSEEYPYRPFCSHRCQLIDLGEWASESYRVPASDDNQNKEEWE
ncbi:MAG: endogenous inhibitor of DNA gyrase (YacG/DUF329 family) [Cellvibrionaceae bacterium]|jgi:endogenous inhibitor of DNA gyrase (YacG/DUF329 family)